jgi:L-threonylcarbamoyladenylate synthase
MLTLNRQRPSPVGVTRLARWLKAGLPVVAPTETQYALLADATSAAAIEAVRAIKGRSYRQPFSVFVLDAAWLPRWGIRLPLAARTLASAFWPGPLTLILPAGNPIFAPLGGCGRSVGVRVSPEPIVQRLLVELGHPLVATSANPSGRQLPPTAENRWLAKQVEQGRVIWARPARFFRRDASTVVDCTGPVPRQRRAGPIPRDRWQAVVAETRRS